MNDYRGFDDRNGDSLMLGVLAGFVSGAGMLLISIREWWVWGWGPGRTWSGADIFHAYCLAFWGHFFPSYKNDLGTWVSVESFLRTHRQYESFVASFWVPFFVSGIAGIVVGIIVARISARSASTFVRGGKIN